MILASGDLLTEQELSVPLGFAITISPAPSADGTERYRLEAALEKHRWKLARTAASLGMSRSTLWRKLRRFGIHLRDELS